MYPASAFNQASIGFQFPGQQLSTPLYQSQYGGLTGFNPQIATHFQQAQPQPRGQSLPASGRQYPVLNGTYIPPPSSSSSRRQKYSYYPPPAPSHHYEQRSSRGSQSKKYHKRRSLSPSGTGEQGLYSDHDQQRQERHEQLQEQQLHSGSQSSPLVNRSKEEGSGESDQRQQSQLTESSHGGDATKGGVARTEEAQANVENDRQKSSSKRKTQHRRDHHDNYNIPLSQGIPLDKNLYQQPYQSHHYTQYPTYYEEYRGELPPQLKVHRQPLYTGYNQVYEESIRRGDVTRKYAKRSTRLPPEVKQQLFPHEDDQQKQYPPVHQHQQQQQQAYQFGPTSSGYSQQQQQPYGNIRPSFNPYQPYGVSQVQPNYYSTTPGSVPYNTLQPWSNTGVVHSSGEQEIQHLRHRIRTLEGEIYKLQRKLDKTILNKNETIGGQDGTIRSHHRSKHTSSVSPRQTPVIVELNNTTGGTIRDSSSKKKHRHRTVSNRSSQPEQHHIQQDLTTGIISGQNQRTLEARQHSQTDGHQTFEGETKPPTSKNLREETAARLAQAAAAHVNSRQGFTGVSSQQQQQQQQASVPTPPPPVPHVGRTQLPNQQQQFLYQQGVLPPQGQQIHGPSPHFPGAGNIGYSGDPYQQQHQQQFIDPHQRILPNQNYNQSNNNELYDDGDDDDGNDNDEEEHRPRIEQNRSVEKILDAFERFYINRGKPTTVPMKVKYIPEDNNSNQKYIKHFHQRNTNNNNQYHSTTRQNRSSSSSSESIYSNSPSLSRRSLYDNNHRKSTTNSFI